MWLVERSIESIITVVPSADQCIHSTERFMQRDIYVCVHQPISTHQHPTRQHTVPSVLLPCGGGGFGACAHALSSCIVYGSGASVLNSQHVLGHTWGAY